MAVFPWIQTKSNVLLAFVIVEKVIKSTVLMKLKNFMRICIYSLFIYF